MEAGEAYVLEYNNGTGWQVARTWVRGVDFDNNDTVSPGTNWKEETVEIDASTFTNVALRFRCDASGNGDKIFIDNVTFKGI